MLGCWNGACLSKLSPRAARAFGRRYASAPADGCCLQMVFLLTASVGEGCLGLAGDGLVCRRRSLGGCFLIDMYVWACSIFEERAELWMVPGGEDVHAHSESALGISGGADAIDGAGAAKGAAATVRKLRAKSFKRSLKTRVKRSV